LLTTAKSTTAEVALAPPLTPCDSIDDDDDDDADLAADRVTKSAAAPNCAEEAAVSVRQPMCSGDRIDVHMYR
jgi:hypothetical protein